MSYNYILLERLHSDGYLRPLSLEEPPPPPVKSSASNQSSRFDTRYLIVIGLLVLAHDL